MNKRKQSWNPFRKLFLRLAGMNYSPEKKPKTAEISTTENTEATEPKEKKP